MFVTYSLDSFHDNYNMPDSFYERFRLTRPELNRPGLSTKKVDEILASIKQDKALILQWFNSLREAYEAEDEDDDSDDADSDDN